MSLEHVKVGDYLVTHCIGEGCIIIHKVTKLTPTQVVCSKTRFRIRDGYKIGSDTWDRGRYARVPTDDDIISYKARIAKRNIYNNLDKVSKETLIKLWKMMKDNVK